MLPGISVVDGHKLRVLAFDCETLGRISRRTIDMTPYAGQYCRLWLDDDGTYSLDPRSGHFWQVAEFRVPEIGYKQVASEEIDDQGEPVMISQAQPLDLTGMEVQRWELPN